MRGFPEIFYIAVAKIFLLNFATRAGSPIKHVPVTVHRPLLFRCVGFSESEKPEYLEKNPQRTEKVNYRNSIYQGSVV